MNRIYKTKHNIGSREYNHIIDWTMFADQRQIIEEWENTKPQ